MASAKSARLLSRSPQNQSNARPGRTSLARRDLGDMNPQTALLAGYKTPEGLCARIGVVMSDGNAPLASPERFGPVPVRANHQH